MAEQRRIGMWSGPRSLSTALLRSWESRADTAVTDEPFFGYYIMARGATRPGRERFMPHDWRTIVAGLEGPIPDGRQIWYQKHHARHLSPQVPRHWIDGLRNCFLIRDPRLVVSSYSRIRPSFTASALGYPQLMDIYDYVCSVTDSPPVILDASDLNREPRPYLEALCVALGVDFDHSMLSWTAGPRAGDPEPGDPWYTGVHDSTGFFPHPEPDEVAVPDRYRAVVAECASYYEPLYDLRLLVGSRQ